MPQQDPLDSAWVGYLERLGLPLFLILFGCLIIWKLLPHVIDWFKSATGSHNAVASAVPDIKESLRKLADEGNEKLDLIDRRTQTIELRTAAIENRLNNPDHPRPS